MDRRQQKTRTAIFQAFSRLMETKRFEHITVQQIIDEANIGRSTFYAHFETKDNLLKVMCTDIFHHVFSETLKAERTHDFSSDSSELFVRYFRSYLVELFSEYEQQFPGSVPADFVIHHLTGSFIEMVRWWCSGGMECTPEEVTAYYMKVVAPTLSA